MEEMIETNLLAELIREKRLNSKLSQTELAERISGNSTYISTIESGKVVPGPKYLKKIAEALSVEEEEFLELRKQIKTNEKSEEKSVIKNVEENAAEVKVEKNVISLEDRKKRQSEKVEVNLDNITSVGKLFSEVRKSKGYTIARLVKEMGTSSQSHISQIENGKARPGIKIVTSFAETFDLPIDRCLRIAGFKTQEKSELNKDDSEDVKLMVNVNVDESQKTFTVEQMEKMYDELAKENEQLVEDETEQIFEEATGSNIVDTVDAEDIEESFVEETETKTENEKIQEDVVVQVSENEFPNSVESAMEKLTYNFVARSVVNLTSGKRYVTELLPLVENQKNNEFTYELMLNIDGENNSSIILSIANDELSIEMQKKAN